MPTFDLKKGGPSFNLSKQAPHVRKFRVGMAWDKPADLPPGVKFDADLSAAVLKLDPAGKPKLLGEMDLIFFNNERGHPAVKHSGDEREGTKVGDDEKISVDPTLLDPEVVEVAFVGSIYSGQTWGELNAVARLYDDETNEVLAEYRAGAEAGDASGMHFVSLYKENGQYTFVAIAQGYKNASLDTFVAQWT